MPRGPRRLSCSAPIRGFTIISKASCRREISRGDVRDQDRWIFAHAATWPDLVRTSKGAVNRQDVSEYSRPWWHFINEPVFLNDDERRQLEREIKVNRRRDPPQSDDDEFMNIVQAIKNSARIVRDTSAPKEKRSVHLCWILHLTGDSHQPLHSVALYTTHRFRKGDHGGNYLDYQHSWDLHGFWDEQISTDDSYETHQMLAADLDRNRKLAEDGQESGRDARRPTNGSTRAWNWPSDTVTRRKCWRKSPPVKDIRILARSTCRRITRSKPRRLPNGEPSRPLTAWPATFKKCCNAVAEFASIRQCRELCYGLFRSFNPTFANNISSYNSSTGLEKHADVLVVQLHQVRVRGRPSVNDRLSLPRFSFVEAREHR